jgi:PAS domain S-box-containing protein
MHRAVREHDPVELAAENARLARERDRALDFTRKLQELSALLGGAVRRDDVVRIVLEGGLDACGAVSACVALDDGGGHVRIAGERGYGEHLSDWQRFEARDDLPVGRAMRGRSGVYCSSRAERDAEFPSMVGLGPGGSRALAALPLQVGGEPAGALVLGYASEHSFEPDERLFLETLAAQAGQALERARLFDLHECQASAAQVLAASLALERERLEEILNQMPAAALIRDASPERRVVLANERARELLGDDMPETLDEADGVVLGSRRHDVERIPIVRAIRDGEIIRDEEVTIGRSDGASFSVLTSAAPIRDAEGAIVAGIATFHDVTAQREAQRERDALHRQVSLERERLRAVLEQMPSGVFLADAEGRLLLGNGQVETIWRQPVLERAAQGDYAPFHGFHLDGRPYAPEEWPLARALLAGERIEHEEIEIERGDGTRGVLRVGAAPIRDEEGAIVAGVAVFADVTHEREARAEAERRADAAAALTFVADGICLVDVDGAVRLWNDAARRTTGLRADDVLGRPLREVLWRWDDLEPRVPVAWAGQRPRPLTLPFEFEGREAWLSISGVRFHGGAVYAFRDVTEEHALETMKSDFIATVSHELRTPLSAVYGAASTLRNRSVLGVEERGQLLAMIEEQSERLSRIVDEILTASRLESGEVAVSLTSVDGAAVVRDVVAVVERGIPAGFTIEVGAAEPAPPVLADADRLRQVLANLLENAVKYSGDATEVEVRIEPSGDRVRFAVCDHGIGIAPVERERIFEKFYRVDAAMTGGVSGTGLGLYIVRELVTRMDGRIRVEPAAGGGSTFLVELPAA